MSQEVAEADTTSFSGIPLVWMCYKPFSDSLHWDEWMVGLAVGGKRYSWTNDTAWQQMSWITQSKLGFEKIVSNSKAKAYLYFSAEYWIIRLYLRHTYWGNLRSLSGGANVVVGEGFIFKSLRSFLAGSGLSSCSLAPSNLKDFIINSTGVSTMMSSFSASVSLFLCFRGKETWQRGGLKRRGLTHCSEQFTPKIPLASRKSL